MLSDLDQWKRVEELFHAVLLVPAGERPAWLAQHCDPPELAGEVRALVDAYEEQERLEAVPAEAPSTKGTRMGPYVLERKIGEGGMGAVYLANREDGQFDQRVAIKVMGRQAAGELFLERFRLERQILASLNHPCISRLLDGGAAVDGTLYLAMEYVEGAPIDQYCNDRVLDRRARLKLFAAVCPAVQYAHRNLVVHRDLKPENILVQNDGTPKLLDFGTAKLLTPVSETAESKLTQVGFRLFTPAYASPEQVLGYPVTTASDIYSLGVILYRLMAGRAPYELTEGTTAQLIEVVCNAEPARAGVDPDIDAIIAKCLRKEPSERYRSVDELIDDLGFYLDGRPVIARRGSWRYRAWKFVERNQVAAAGSVLLAASIVLGVAGVLWQARIAQERYRDLRGLTNSLLFELNGVIRELPGSTAAQKLLVTRVLENLDKLASGSASDSLIQADLVEAYLKMGNLQGNPYEQNLGDPEGGLATLRKALGMCERLVARQPSDQKLLRTDAMLRQSISDLLYGSGSPKEAIENGTVAAAMLEKLAGMPDAPASLITEAAVSYETLGDEYGQIGTASMGDSKAGLERYAKALELERRAMARDPGYVRARRGIAVLQMKIGSLQLDYDPEKALESFVTAIQTFDALPEKEKESLGSRRIRSGLLRKAGNAYEALEQWDEALGYYNQALRTEEAFAAVDPDDSRAQLQLAVVLNSIAMVEEGKGDRTTAYQTSERVRSILEGMIRHDPHNPIWKGHWAEVMLRMATLAGAMGQKADSAKLNAQAVAAARELAARPDASELDLCRAGRALAGSEPRIAVTYAERCAAGAGRRSPDGMRVLAQAYRAAGRTEEGRAAAREGLALLPAPSGKARGPWVRQQLEEAAR